MPAAPERFASRRDTLAFLICLVCAGAARVAPLNLQQAVASGITDTIAAPFLVLQEQIRLLKAARATVNERFAVADSLAVEQLETESIRAENRRLRSLLELSARLPVQHVAAEVLRQEGDVEHTKLLLSVGQDRGVEQNNPVVAPGGIVGVIESVSARTSIAMTWTHQDFRASAMTRDDADNEVFGIVVPVTGEAPDTAEMELQGVPFRRHILTGATVRTSGRGLRLGGVYPIGIPIGTVIEVREEREGWYRTYRIMPAVQPASLSHVIVLTQLGGSLASSFEEERP